ncbi:MAG: bifunctional phosphoglucose/phosphomannose isomerase [Chloroflexi bacterium]|nr:bifunctional phosphoglucose/phosphomannose isomerase [Chloroflexota bacterium]
MNRLDDINQISRLDADDMLSRIVDFPNQCRDAWHLAETLELGKAYRQVRNVVIAGMGGSAIGGDLVAGLVDEICPVPIAVVRGYGLPAHVDSHTLVVGSSYSGNTGETLAAVAEAWDQDAQILVITTGGEIASWAEERGLPALTYAYRAQPRAALGYALCALLGVLDRLGLVPAERASLDEAIEAAQQAGQNWRVEQALAENPAKQMARRLHGKLAVVYGAAHLAAVARRWKTQINENSKGWAFWEEFPELNHNAVVGYDLPASVAAQTHVVMLASPTYHHAVRQRLEITGMLLSEAGVSWEKTDAVGDSRLAQMLSMIHLGDYVSFYLAMLNDVDPTPVEPIARLKEALQASAG